MSSSWGWVFPRRDCDNIAINDGDCNRTVQSGTGMCNNSTGNENSVGQFGKGNKNTINGNESKTYQNGYDNQASATANSARTAQFGNNRCGEATNNVHDVLQGDPHEGWSWDSFERFFEEIFDLGWNLGLFIWPPWGFRAWFDRALDE